MKLTIMETIRELAATALSDVYYVALPRLTCSARLITGPKEELKVFST
jgi:hypothetical protein